MFTFEFLSGFISYLLQQSFQIGSMNFPYSKISLFIYFYLLKFHDFEYNYCEFWAFVIAQLVNNPPAMQETLVWFLGQQDPWRRDWLPTPVFLGFPCGSAGKESVSSVGDPGSIPGLGRSLEKEKATHSSNLPGEFHGLYSHWGHKESDTPEQLSHIVNSHQRWQGAGWTRSGQY